jgi:nucleoside-diphosphate-sugar epimerase
LARNDAAADALAQAGVQAHRGDLTDLDSLVAGAKACDGVIHTAFVHDFTQLAANIETDRRAVEAMTGALEGSGKPMVIASGTMMASHARPATERDGPLSPEMPRVASELMVLAADRGFRGSVVRLPPTVHGAGDHGFVPRLITSAREKGVSAYVGDGLNRWPAVHRLDAARVFRLALEKAVPGTRLHAVAEEGVPMRSIAEAIGEGLGVPAKSVTQEEAPAYLDFLAMFAPVDNPASSALTREWLGWRPEGPELLTDMRENGYFA